MVRMWNIILDENGNISMNGIGDDGKEFFVRFDPRTWKVIECDTDDEYYVGKAVVKVSKEWEMGCLQSTSVSAWY